MTSEAPERIIVAKCHSFKEPDDFYVCHPRLQHPAGIEYIRADLHQQALEAAREEGYARAVGEVFDKVESLSHQWGEDGCSYIDRDEALTEIRALTQKEGE